mmetsp:Transcript_32024/g.93593  ORF Transcript_32024/g.93593 Transcript_32024/m.93593 type:complete len:220 (+) Transcript_32024:1254-1913(+)
MNVARGNVTQAGAQTLCMSMMRAGKCTVPMEVLRSSMIGRRSSSSSCRMRAWFGNGLAEKCQRPSSFGCSVPKSMMGNELPKRGPSPCSSASSTTKQRLSVPASTPSSRRMSSMKNGRPTSFEPRRTSAPRTLRTSQNILRNEPTSTMMMMESTAGSRSLQVDSAAGSGSPPSIEVVLEEWAASAHVIAHVAFLGWKDLYPSSPPVHSPSPSQSQKPDQ